MNTYTSKSIAESCPVGKSFQVWFSRTSAAYQSYGAYIVGWQIERQASDLDSADFPLTFEVLTRENALIEVGSEYEAAVPQLTRASFHGSEVTRIIKHG